MSAEISKQWKVIKIDSWIERMQVVSERAQRVIMGTDEPRSDGTGNGVERVLSMLMAARLLAEAARVPWSWSLEQVETWVVGPPEKKKGDV